jgi:arylsulfatase
MRKTNWLSRLAFIVMISGWLPPGTAWGQATAARNPNIIFILADDLGYNEVGAYGQKKIRTPNIDRLAQEGVRLTDHYSGSPVCAPSRAVLLTGLHTGHAYIRDNDEMGDRGDVWRDLSLEGQRPLPAGTITIASVLKRAGYATAAVGKWGLGGPGTTGEPTTLGFDLFFGFLCQRIAHNHYPPYLWRNRTAGFMARSRGEIVPPDAGHEAVAMKVPLDNSGIYPHEKLPADKDPNALSSYERYGGKQYALDVMGEEARAFVRDNKARPFFLYFAPTIPHAALQVPEDSLAEYAGAFPETPYPGDKGYLPQRAPRAAYAAMVTRLDREVGRLTQLVRDLGLDRDTLIIFTSDNGPTFNGGTDSAFFESAGPFRGLKTMVYEGGIRVPMVARWPGRIPAGTVSAHASAFEDYLPTFAAMAGIAPPTGSDGLSMLAAFEGRASAQRPRDYLYWEFQGKQAVRMGAWKGIRTAASGEFELYDLATDIGEQHNVASANTAIVSRIETIMRTARTESALFPLVKATKK